MKGLTDIAGIRVGHVTDREGVTGCTVIICEGGAVGGVDIRGSATGTEEADVLSPGHVTEKVHGLVLSGGSAFGLESASGVRRYLEHQGIGFRLGNQVVPIVPAAILYDLGIGKSHVRPTREMGEAAAAAASTNPVDEGSVGAGTGATLGKLFGMARAMKGGLGTYTVSLAPGLMVSAIAAVNAVGDVRDPVNGQIVAGARKSATSREFINSEEAIKTGAAGTPEPRNTTLVVVATNAKLTKVGATKLAQFGSLGMARTIYPVNTMMDGDITFALSVGERSADINVLGIAAAEAVSQAILRAVRLASTLGGVPGLAG